MVSKEARFRLIELITFHAAVQRKNISTLLSRSIYCFDFSLLRFILTTLEEFNWVNVIVADLLKTQELSGIEIYSPTFVVSSGDPRQMIENEAKVCKFIRISQKMYQPSEIKEYL